MRVVSDVRSHVCALNSCRRALMSFYMFVIFSGASRQDNLFQVFAGDVLVVNSEESRCCSA